MNKEKRKQYEERINKLRDRSYKILITHNEEVTEYFLSQIRFINSRLIDLDRQIQNSKIQVIPQDETYYHELVTKGMSSRERAIYAFNNTGILNRKSDGTYTPAYTTFDDSLPWDPSMRKHSSSKDDK